MSLNVKKCRECGNLFQYTGKDICNDCFQKLDEYFVQVRDYLDEHPNAKVAELSEELDIKERIILDFIKQGRLILKEAVLQCVNCGKPICTGKMCDECVNIIGGRINQVVSEKKKQLESFETGVSINETGGMHVKK